MICIQITVNLIDTVKPLTPVEQARLAEAIRQRIQTDLVLICCSTAVRDVDEPAGIKHEYLRSTILDITKSITTDTPHSYTLRELAQKYLIHNNYITVDTTGSDGVKLLDEAEAIVHERFTKVDIETTLAHCSNLSDGDLVYFLQGEHGSMPPGTFLPIAELIFDAMGDAA